MICRVMLGAVILVAYLGVYVFIAKAIARGR